MIERNGTKTCSRQVLSLRVSDVVVAIGFTIFFSFVIFFRICLATKMFVCVELPIFRCNLSSTWCPFLKLIAHVLYYHCRIVSLMSPDDSWVAKWQRISKFTCVVSTHKRGSGKVMFSVMSVCLFRKRRIPMWPLWTCSNFYIWVLSSIPDQTCSLDYSCPPPSKLVHLLPIHLLASGQLAFDWKT